jgi:hypothetical protein
MPDLALLIEGGSFFSGKRKCAVSVDDADSVEAATAKIWAALGMAEQASSGNIEIFEASWDEYVVFEETDQLANKAKLRLAPSSAPADSPAEPPAEESPAKMSESEAAEAQPPAPAAPDEVYFQHYLVITLTSLFHQLN